MSKEIDEKEDLSVTDEKEEPTARADEELVTDPMEAAEPDHKEETNSDQNEKNDNIVDFEEKKKSVGNAEVEKLQQEIADLKTTVQRTQADFINYKRRTEEERAKIALFANELLIVELLSVLDNFDRSLQHQDDSGKSFVEGILLIKKQILDLLEKNQVKEIPTDGDFDPNFHYAVLQEEGEEANKILEVLQKGYTLGDKVIRPSMVKVSK